MKGRSKVFKKNNQQDLYLGLLMEIKKVIKEPGKMIKMECEEGTERIVLLRKDPIYNAYHDIFTSEPYYELNDLSLKVGDPALVAVHKDSSLRKKPTNEELRNYHNELNNDLKVSKDINLHKLKLSKTITHN